MKVVQNVPWIISLGTENFNRRSRLDPTWLIVENELLNLRFSTSPLAKYKVGGMAVALFNIYSSLLDHIMWEIWVYRSLFISPYTVYLASYLERNCNVQNNKWMRYGVTMNGKVFEISWKYYWERRELQNVLWIISLGTEKLQQEIHIQPGVAQAPCDDHCEIFVRYYEILRDYCDSRSGEK